MISERWRSYLSQSATETSTYPTLDHLKHMQKKPSSNLDKINSIFKRKNISISQLLQRNALFTPREFLPQSKHAFKMRSGSLYIEVSSTSFTKNILEWSQTLKDFLQKSCVVKLDVCYYVHQDAHQSIKIQAGMYGYRMLECIKLTNKDRWL